MKSALGYSIWGFNWSPVYNVNSDTKRKELLIIQLGDMCQRWMSFLLITIWVLCQNPEKKHAKRMNGTGTRGERLDCTCIELGLLI